MERPRVKTKSPIRFILVTGLSGAGKSSALKVLEDQGFLTVDNLPMALLSDFLALLKKSKKHKVALGMDARENNFPKAHRQALHALDKAGIKAEILFLESDAKVLLRRFSEHRRTHPLMPRFSLVQALSEERRRLQNLRKIATQIFDTSSLNPHEFKKKILHYLNPSSKDIPFTITLMSFGFKNGIPAESDLVFDVRFLENPYFVPRLKKLSGLNPSVQRFVLKQKNAKLFLKQLSSLLKFLLPLYQKEGKSQLTIALGCTGGQHRSIALVEELAKIKELKKWKPKTFHRGLVRSR